MKLSNYPLLAVWLVLWPASHAPGAETKTPAADWRNAQSGSVIPDEGYCDQPYVVVTGDGHWLCVLTTGPGREGQRGQHVVSTISRDQGRTWSKPLDIEPSDGPEASWATPLVTPFGRVYVFYDYNGDRVSALGGKPARADMLGWYCYRFSDDGGQSWSAMRYRLPMRLTDCDRANDWQGKVQIFWGISKPIVRGDSALFAFTKLGRYLLDDGEGWFFTSDNILNERDPERLHWQMLPDGQRGLRDDRFGSVQEEHNVVPLADGSLYCIYRTTTGSPCQAYSRDGGHTWTTPEHATYEPGGRTIKHPRACPKLWRTSEGKYLLWFHNHGGKTFEGRNPAWIAGGVERDGHIYWSQPEVLLYEDDPKTRMSYPDLVEQDGRFWVTETQKTVARVHPIDRTLFEGMWRQVGEAPSGEARRGSASGGELPKPLLRLDAAQLRSGEAVMPRFAALEAGGGLTIELDLKLGDARAGQVIVDATDAAGRGVRVTAADRGRLQLELSDGSMRSAWASDAGLLSDGKSHHVVIVVDGGPKLITFVVDGLLCDGGTERPAGWGRFDGGLKDLGDPQKLRCTSPPGGELSLVRIYDRPMRHYEAVARYRAGDRAP